MATIAVIISNMFEDSEYSEPVKAFLAAGNKIVHIGIHAGETVKGIKKGTPVIIDRELKGLQIAGFDALLIPGGYSPDQLRISEDALRFTREFVESGKPVFVICHGPQLLISARVVKGRKMTSWKSVKEDLINAGADFVDQDVVEDGNIISSRSPADLQAFIKASLNKLG